MDLKKVDTVNQAIEFIALAVSIGLTAVNKELLAVWAVLVVIASRVERLSRTRD